MKKIFVIILIIINLIYLPISAFAITKEQLSEVSKIESEIFGFDYTSDSITNRIARLEKNIYGKTNNGKIENRIKKIATDINSEQLGKEIEPVEDTFKENEDIVADNTVNYPIVDEIEKRLFNQTYKNRDFHTRIVTIERKIFGKIYDVDDYATRMDRIKAEIMPEKLAEEKVFGSERNFDYSNSLSAKDLGGLGFNRFAMPYGQENYTRPYLNYGEYGGSATGFSSTPDIEEELAKLEYDTFGTEFSNDDTQTRMKRLKSVNKAKKSSNIYESQKLNQRMSTFMEIGSILLMILAMVL